MAVTDQPYYINYTPNNEPDWTFRIEFIAADTSDLTSTTALPFPAETAINKCIIRNEFDNNLPIGQQIAAEMEIEIDLIGLETNTDLQSAIINSRTTDTREVTDWDGSNATYSDDIYIDNVWILRSNNGDGTTNHNTIHFIGVQDKRPEQTFTFTSSDVKEQSCRLNIKCLDITRKALEHITNLQIRGLSSYTLAPIRIFDYLYDVSGTVSWTGYVNRDGYEIRMVKLSDYYNRIEQETQRYLRVLIRQSDAAFTFENTPTVAVDLYSNTYTSLTYPKDNSLKDGTTDSINDNVYIIGLVLDGTDVIGGMLDTNENNESNATEQNYWDVLKQEAEQYMALGTISYPDSKTAKITYNKILDGDTFTINESNYIGEIKIKKGSGLVAETNAHLRETFDNDLAEIQYRNGGFRIEKSYETKFSLHNNAVKNEDGTGRSARVESGTGFVVQTKMTPTFRNLYYKDTVTTTLYTYTDYFLKVNDYAIYTIDDVGSAGDVQYTSEPEYTDYQLPDYSDRKDFFKLLTAFNRNRANVSGMPYVFAKAVANFLGNPNQAEVEFKVPINKTTTNNLGEMFYIDPDIVPITTGLPLYNRDVLGEGNNVVVNVEMDIINFESIVKSFWIEDLD
jgi:hypothetical protein